MAMQLPSTSSSFSYAFTYQVFLSFRGTDTRHGFTGNLYKALMDKGIHTFIDDNDLQRGDEITPSLLKAIEESRIFIPVFSINYASSSFCLDELVHIIHCYKTKGRSVLPVFFGVDPSHVRHHKGSYGKALAEHEKRFQNDKNNMERLQRWKVALNQTANLSGYHFSLGYEYEFVGKIVKDISDKINRVILHVAKYPVGLESQVQQVKLLLDKESNEGVNMVALYGTGGLGKSTLAKAIYNFVADQFEGVCFLHNVRENSTRNNLEKLQKELLSKTVKLDIKLGDVSEGIPIIKERLCRKKILLILDDVDKLEQLEALAGGLDWFGRGSRVIITTRDKHLLTYHGIERTYAVKGLHGAEALELLSRIAFKNGKVPSGYEVILNRTLTYASGLPLAIVTIGSNLFAKSVEDWNRTLDEYEKIPNKDIQRILKVSYDALEEKDQSVFLDISCCFKGCKWTEVEEILHAHYGHCIKHHLGVLTEKSLIDNWEFGGNVRLHDLIEDMGKEIVRQESPKKPGERSRLWFHDDIVQVIKENVGTGNIELIYLMCPSMENVIDWDGTAFRKMTNLKTLIIENGHFSKGPEYLPSSLRFWKWNGCPAKSLSCFSNKKFENMKVLILDHCQYLTHIPDVSGLSNLEKFSFQNCYNLITIHNSIGNLNKLETLNAWDCFELESFPPLRLPSLKKLELSFRGSIKSFPELLCKMKNIKEIELRGNSIIKLPFSFQYLSELRDLTIRECSMLRFSNNNDKMNSIVLSNVEDLNLQSCYLPDECLPILLKWCANVKHLDLSENNFKILPECLSECHLLWNLNLDFCEFLEEIRGIPPNLHYLSAIDCKSLSSSCRRMLLSQKLHEAGCTNISLPSRTEGIPAWFEHQIRGHRTISFWFRKKVPSVTSIIHVGSRYATYILNLFVNGDPCNFPEYVNLFVNGDPCNFPEDDVELPPEHTFLFDLKLEEVIHNMFESEIDEALLENKWVHVELKLTIAVDFGISHVLKIKTLRSAEMGIHVLKEKNNTEEDVTFTKPYTDMEEDEKTNTEDDEFYEDEESNTEEDMVFTQPYLNTSLSQFEPLLKKPRWVKVGVSKAEISQQQHRKFILSLQQRMALLSLQQQMALLPQQQRITVLSGMWNLLLNEIKKKEHQD